MFDIIIIGAGVIGLSIARAIGERTNLSVLIIDKEDDFGRGISSRNSEVIHSGIYYEPKSLKAKYCTEGRDLLYDYCKRNNIWTKQCGKLIVGGTHQINELQDLVDSMKERIDIKERLIEQNEDKVSKLNKNQKELMEDLARNKDMLKEQMDENQMLLLQLQNFTNKKPNFNKESTHQ